MIIVMTHNRTQRGVTGTECDQGQSLVPLRAADISSDISDQTVRRWARQGRIPAVQLGRRWFIKRDDLAAIRSNGVPVEAAS